MRASLLPLLLASACIEPPYAEPLVQDTGAEDILDLRASWPDPPDGGVQIATPDVRIAPGSEILKCFYGQYDGPDVGVVGVIPLHPYEFHHHSLLKDVPPADPNGPGDFVDCGGPGDSGGMPRAPLFHSVVLGHGTGDGSTVVLPEGMAIPFPSGQEWSADVHYVNATSQTVLLNNAWNLVTVPAADVTEWVGSYEHDIGPLSIPPGGEYEAAFDCPVQAGSSVLSVSSHMHSYGQRYVVDVVRADGRVENILLVDEWKAEYRYEPPQRSFQPGEVVLDEGDVLRTTCTWFNSSDTALTFPTEMCTTSGVATGLDGPLYCEAGELVDRSR